MKRSHALAVAAALLVGGLAGAQLTSGAGESQPSAFVSMTPCRLLDTRPANKIGVLTTFTESKTQAATVWGKNGQCTIPNTATGVAMNVTSVGGTKGSFLTVWPSDATRPGTSNLNWVPGAPPTPNKVDVALSYNGKVSMYNRFGNVDVIADIVGYYEPVVAAKGTVSAVKTVTQVLNVVANADPTTGANGQAIAQCPAGMVAIAGGVENPEQVALNTRSSRPNPDGAVNPTGWFGDVRSATPGAAGEQSTVYAVCITLNL
jgi:hypothetical protein